MKGKENDNWLKAENLFNVLKVLSHENWPVSFFARVSKDCMESLQVYKFHWLAKFGINVHDNFTALKFWGY